MLAPRLVAISMSMLLVWMSGSGEVTSGSLLEDSPGSPVGRVVDQGISERRGAYRRTARQALTPAVPPPRKAVPAPVSPVIDEHAPVINGWLIDGQQAPKKQRHTVRRFWQRLVAEYYETSSEVTVSRFVAKRPNRIGAEQVRRRHSADSSAGRGS